MKEGQQIRLNGQGQSGINGGENGDLYIEIQYKDTDRIRIEGSDVYQTIDVAPWEAALGQSIEVNTPAGNSKSIYLKMQKWTTITSKR
jgi:curved DNA-binding protein